jgi:hypothetical protein
MRLTTVLRLNDIGGGLDGIVLDIIPTRLLEKEIKNILVPELERHLTINRMCPCSGVLTPGLVGGKMTINTKQLRIKTLRGA